ncbi:VIT1/CCC1 transporter family protein [Deinococcus gobiensis]|uniref:Nodulin 21-like protein n=1 Tax=Deinococcus gobiensis (strain DSM 21396 / JCM 16679 / CGMCC 1.7299 / I-0) TaxID=745776 RepID=H8GWF8_DEIGI|nr:VIT1/CCC1 transporter family protein [Deinococcus gobiensis]AFD25708.1 Nodulin 21-like protein [Deinococcus gobiensis I-0]
MTQSHKEEHNTSRVGWLRAAVLGANDGVVSVSSVVVGVAAASGVTSGTVLLAGVAALVAGATSMAAGEYVSVQSQADTEKADLAREAQELRDQPELELQELVDIYVARGLTPELALQVARQLSARDALGTHAREELGITEELRARPFQAALASAVAFVAGGVLPVIAATLLPQARVGLGVTVVTLLALTVLGALAAHAGGAPKAVGALRVTLWGAAAMALSALVGSLFGVKA